MPNFDGIGMAGNNDRSTLSRAAGTPLERDRSDADLSRISYGPLKQPLTIASADIEQYCNLLVRIIRELYKCLGVASLDPSVEGVVDTTEMAGGTAVGLFGGLPNACCSGRCMLLAKVYTLYIKQMIWLPTVVEESGKLPLHFGKFLTYI